MAKEVFITEEGKEIVAEKEIVINGSLFDEPVVSWEENRKKQMKKELDEIRERKSKAIVSYLKILIVTIVLNTGTI